jgi:hypothetical protein
VQLHQVEGLRVHEGVDHVDQDLLHEALDPVPVPAPRELEHPLLEPVHLLLVRTDQSVDELRVCASHELSACDHPRSVHRPGQGERRRARDDRLVEVEERRLHIFMVSVSTGAAEHAWEPGDDRRAPGRDRT